MEWLKLLQTQTHVYITLHICIHIYIYMCVETRNYVLTCSSLQAHVHTGTSPWQAPWPPTLKENKNEHSLRTHSSLHDSNPNALILRKNRQSAGRGIPMPGFDRGRFLLQVRLVEDSAPPAGIHMGVSTYIYVNVCTYIYVYTVGVFVRTYMCTYMHACRPLSLTKQVRPCLSPQEDASTRKKPHLTHTDTNPLVEQKYRPYRYIHTHICRYKSVYTSTPQGSGTNVIYIHVYTCEGTM